jgi:hypothetical protein
VNPGPADSTAGDGAAVHPEMLGAYATGLLDPEERAALQAHLRRCRTCSDEVAELTRLREAIDSLPPEAVLIELERLASAPEPRPARSATAPPPDVARRLDGASRPAQDGGAARGPGWDDDWSLEDWDALTQDVVVDEHGDPAADLVLARTVSAMRAERTPARRVPLLAIAASIILIAVFSAAMGTWIANDNRAGDSPPAAAVPAGSRLLQTTDPTTRATLTARITPAGNWTRLGVSVTGVPPGTTCRIVAVSRDGTQEIAGNWVVVAAAPGASPVEVDGSTAIAPDQLETIEIIDGTGKHLVGLRT